MRLQDIGSLFSSPGVTTRAGKMTSGEDFQECRTLSKMLADKAGREVGDLAAFRERLFFGLNPQHAGGHIREQADRQSGQQQAH